MEHPSGTFLMFLKRKDAAKKGRILLPQGFDLFKGKFGRLGDLLWGKAQFQHPPCSGCDAFVSPQGDTFVSPQGDTPGLHLVQNTQHGYLLPLS